MSKKELMVVTYFSQDSFLNMAEICEILRVSKQMINTLIENDIIHPKRNVDADWTFDFLQIKRIQRALRLQRDLELNLAGIALVLDLLEEVESLRARNALFEKHFLKL